MENGDGTTGKVFKEKLLYHLILYFWRVVEIQLFKTQHQNGGEYAQGQVCFAQDIVPELPMKASGATSNMALSAHSVTADPVSKGFLVARCMQWRGGLQNVVRTCTEFPRYHQHCSKEKQPWWRSGGLLLCVARSWTLPRVENPLWNRYINAILWWLTVIPVLLSKLLEWQ